MKTVLDIIVHELTGIPYHVGHARMIEESKRIFVKDTPRTEFINAMRFIGILLVDYGVLINLTDVEKYKLLISVTAFYIIANRGNIDVRDTENTLFSHYPLTVLMLKAGGADIREEIDKETNLDPIVSKLIAPFVDVDLETCDLLVTRHLELLGFDFS